MRRLVCVLLLVATVRAEDGWATVQVEGAICSFDAPTAWKLEPTKFEGTIYGAWGTVPGAKRRFWFELEIAERVNCDRLVAAQMDCEHWRVEEKARSTVVGLDPVPHLRVEFVKGGKDRVRMTAYRRTAGRSIQVRFDCDAADSDALLADFWRVARSLRGEWRKGTPIPDTYRVVKTPNFQVYVHPAVAGDLKPTLGLLADTRKWFEESHGASPKAEPASTVIVLARFEEGRALSDWVGDVFAEYRGLYNTDDGRLYLLACPDRKDPSAFWVAYWTWSLLHERRFGCEPAYWVREGESTLAGVRARCGKPLPWVDAEWFGRLRADPGLLADLAPMNGIGDWNRDQKAAYVALFLLGPDAYRKAYQAHLDDLLAGKDGTLSSHDRFLSFDGSTLRGDAMKVLKAKLKATKGP